MSDNPYKDGICPLKADDDPNDKLAFKIARSLGNSWYDRMKREWEVDESQREKYTSNSKFSHSAWRLIKDVPEITEAVALRAAVEELREALIAIQPELESGGDTYAINLASKALANTKHLMEEKP